MVGLFIVSADIYKVYYIIERVILLLLREDVTSWPETLCGILRKSCRNKFLSFNRHTHSHIQHFFYHGMCTNPLTVEFI